MPTYSFLSGVILVFYLMVGIIIFQYRIVQNFQIGSVQQIGIGMILIPNNILLILPRLS